MIAWKFNDTTKQLDAIDIKSIDCAGSYVLRRNNSDIIIFDRNKDKVYLDLDNEGRYRLSIKNLRRVTTPSIEHEAIVFLCDKIHELADNESIKNVKTESQDYFEHLVLMSDHLDGGSRNVFLEKPLDLPLWITIKRD
jgi:hypothetical protein